MQLLNGKVILITGAGRGIGRAHALELSHWGATIVANDVGAAVTGAPSADDKPADEVVAEIIAAGGHAIASHDDISTWAGAKNAVHAGLERFGRLDGVINNAGNMRSGPLLEMTEDDFDALAAVHLKGSFACAIHACRHWQALHRAGAETTGAIVNTISETMLAGTPNYAGYAAMKAGIAQLTLTGSREAAAFGARINAYAPRAFTRMSSRPLKSPDLPSSRHAGNTSPLVAWLLSDRSRHVSGQLFQTVGGGICLCSPWHTDKVFYPSIGFRFTLDEVDELMQTHIFATSFTGRALEPLPDD